MVAAVRAPRKREWPIFPYESAFVHVREGLPGAPALFRTALTLRVEKTMRESGVLPKDAETEPCDSAWNEWAFLSFLLGSEAASLEAEDEEAVRFGGVGLLISFETTRLCGCRIS